jgi:single-stranded-DNA-specific exonuclease
MEQIDTTQEMMIDGIATIAGARADFVHLISNNVGPFGPKNPQPVFALSNVRVQTADVLKDKHIRLMLSDWEGGKRIKAMFFYGVGTPIGEAVLKNSQSLFHFAGQFKINAWQGRENVEFLISDAAFAAHAKEGGQEAA